MSVLLGYDESPGADRALDTAITVATRLAEPLVLVYGAAPPGRLGEELRSHREAPRHWGTEPSSTRSMSRAPAASRRRIRGALLGSTPHRLLPLSTRPVVVGPPA